MIIGTNSVGKTTLARAIHRDFIGLYVTILDNIATKWKEFDEEKGVEKMCAFTNLTTISANIGILSEAATGGADSISSRFQSEVSLRASMKSNEIVTLEPIMATRPYFDMVKDLCTSKGAKLFLIHLDIKDDEALFGRLRKRRALKKGIDINSVIIEEKTRENVLSKVRNFRNLFDKCFDEAEYSLRIDTSAISEKGVFSKVIKKLEKIVLSI